MLQKALPKFEVALARDAGSIAASQRLRYEVFVEELGSDGPLVDHTNRLEKDRFDEVCEHLLLYDRANRTSEVVGVYRLMPPDRFASFGRYYSEGEYDLAPLMSSGRRLLELGRSCLHADYRGGAAMHHLWQGLAQYIEANRIELLFGVASFHGADASAHAEPLSLLHQNYLAPASVRPRALPEGFFEMNQHRPDQIDRVRAMRAMPQLIKAYLRLGGMVGDGAFQDKVFNTTDICMILDTAKIGPKQRARLTEVRA
ncbi:MAG: GNAT family N-acyltransferase [Pseudomonadota bacterium]